MQNNIEKTQQLPSQVVATINQNVIDRLNDLFLENDTIDLLELIPGLSLVGALIVDKDDQFLNELLFKTISILTVFSLNINKIKNEMEVCNA